MASTAAPHPDLLTTVPPPPAPRIQHRGFGPGLCFGGLAGMLAATGSSFLVGAGRGVLMLLDTGEIADALVVAMAILSLGTLIGAPLGLILGSVAGGALGAGKSAAIAPRVAAGLALIVGALLGQIILAGASGVLAAVFFFVVWTLIGGIGWLVGTLFAKAMRSSPSP